MNVTRWIEELKQYRLINEKIFLRHLEVAVRACASNKSLNMYRKEFPNEVMKVERGVRP